MRSAGSCPQALPLDEIAQDAGGGGLGVANPLELAGEIARDRDDVRRAGCSSPARCRAGGS